MNRYHELDMITLVPNGKQLKLLESNNCDEYDLFTS